MSQEFTPSELNKQQLGVIRAQDEWQRRQDAIAAAKARAAVAAQATHDIQHLPADDTEGGSL